MGVHNSGSTWQNFKKFFFHSLIIIIIKKIAGVVPGPRQSHPSASPLSILIFITPGAGGLVMANRVSAKTNSEHQKEISKNSDPDPHQNKITGCLYVAKSIILFFFLKSKILSYI